MQVIVLRYSEIHLKGANRGFFEKMLLDNIKVSLNGFKFSLEKTASRYIIRDFEESEISNILSRLEKVFGVHSMSIAEEVKTDIGVITQTALNFSPSVGSFKVIVNRADKTFPLNSMQLAARLGGEILKAKPLLTVDIHKPQNVVYVDIRENGKTLVYSKVIHGAGGMPVGTGGKGLLLLSGGIDSPVAGYMMAKRGMSIRAIHFHSYPFTSQLAKEKVLTLAQCLKQYSMHLTVDIISVTEIQTEIHKKCREDYMITILRRFMMRIAEKVARQRKIGALITGESLGQVASQTLESLTSSNAVVTMPIFRPLIGFDKEEIINVSRKIGAFETSILPHEDCCTVFLPQNPVTKPRLDVVEKLEEALNVDELINNALATIETVII